MAERAPRSGGRGILRDPWTWVGVACAIAFVLLAAALAAGATFAIDETATAAIRGLDIGTAAWEACSFLGGWQARVVVGVLLVGAALATRRFRLALILAVVLAAAPVLGELAKLTVERPRPPDPLTHTTGYAFPSGHTFNSTVTYGVMAVVAWRSRLRSGLRLVAVVVGIAAPVLAGLSRVGLGAHWPTDVIGGWLAGLAVVAFTAVLIRATGAMEPDPRPVRGPSPR